MAFLFRWHRRLALIVALFLLGWTLSGLLHPVMSRLSVPPQRPMPELTSVGVQNVVPAKAVLVAAGIEAYHQLHLLGVDQQSVYLVQVNAGSLPRFFDAVSGDEQPAFGAQWAERLARRYLGRSDAVVESVTPIEAFSDSYPAINRYLPVWQVRFAGTEGFVVSVDAVSGRPAAIEHTLQQRVRKLFQLLHTFSFLPDGAATLWLQLLLISMTFLLAIAGIVLWWRLRQRPAMTALRAWHRRGGLVLSGVLLMFTFSGALHLIEKLMAVPMPPAQLQQANTSEIPTHWPHTMANLPAPKWLRLQAGNILQWRGALAPPTASPPNSGGHAGHDHEAARTPVLASGGWLAADGSELSAAAALSDLARAASCEPVTNSEPAQISRFGGDYGFLNKRLPVWQVECQDGARLFFDSSNDVLAARVLPSERFEAWSFHMLHKWHFLDGLGRDARDGIQALFVFLLAGLTGVGVSIYLIRLRRRSTT